jgi:hypothetical protein
MPSVRPLVVALLAAATVTSAAHAATAPAAKRASATPPSVNLLLNPSFEEKLSNHAWMPAGWDTFPSSLSTVFFGRDTMVAHTGHWSVNVASVSTRVPMWHNWSQTLIPPRSVWGKDVVFTIWTRSLGLQGRAYTLVQAFRDTIGKVAFEQGIPRDTAVTRLGYVVTAQPIVLMGWKRLYFSEEETDWVKRELRMYVPPGTNVIVVRAGLFGTGQVAFDDGALVAVSAAALQPVALKHNLLKDPSFEGDGNDWEYSMPPFPGLVIERDTTVARFGHASMHADPAGNGALQVRSGVGQTIDARPLAGKRVRFSAWVKADSLVGLTYVSLRCTTPGGEVPGPSPEQHSGSFDWRKLTVERDVPGDALTLGAYVEFNCPATGQLWFDDASLEVIGPAEYITKKLPRPVPPPLPEPVQ